MFVLCEKPGAPNGPFDTPEGRLQPTFMLHLSNQVVFHVGLGIGLSKASDNLVRTALAIEF